jgi:hypothetical protein
MIIKCIFSFHSFEDFPNKEYLDYKDKCCKTCGKMKLADRSIDDMSKLELANRHNVFSECTSIIRIELPKIIQL